MKRRDRFIEELKASLDRWNAEATKWEAHADSARSIQLASFRART